MWSEVDAVVSVRVGDGHVRVRGEQKLGFWSGLMDWVQVGVRIRVRVKRWARVESGFWFGLWFGLLSVEGFGIGEGYGYSHGFGLARVRGWVKFVLRFGYVYGMG